MTTADAERKVAAYARREARRAISVGRVNPAEAAQIVADAQAEVTRMRAAAGLGMPAAAWF